MGKLSKDEQNRFGGADWLLRFAKEHGLEAAEEELKRRNVLNIPLALRESDLVKCRSELTNLMLIASIGVLADELELSNEQINSFVERFNLRMRCICDSYVDWKDLRDEISEKYGIEIVLVGED